MVLEFVSIVQLFFVQIHYNEIYFIIWRYLASGTVQRHVASIYRVSKSAFGLIIDEVCDAICIAFQDEFQSYSNSDWLEAANQFNAKWNHPNCLWVIDGKHIAIKCPSNAGSFFYNYKVKCIGFWNLKKIKRKSNWMEPTIYFIIVQCT